MSYMHICPVLHADFYVDGSDKNAGAHAGRLEASDLLPFIQKEMSIIH